MSRLLNYLPWYERESEVFKEILRAEEIEFDKLELDLEDINKQFFVDTATWGLAIYEKELGLPIRPNKSLEERRSIIKAKWRGMGKVDAEMIKAIVKAFTGYEVEVGFNGRIIIDFGDANYINVSIKDMINAIEETKPAHLAYNFQKVNKENIVIQDQYKILKINYKLANRTRTESRKVHSINNNIKLEEKYRLIPVKYKLCGKTKTQSVGSDIQEENLAIQGKYISKRVKYPVTGKIICGGGVR